MRKMTNILLISGGKMKTFSTSIISVILAAVIVCGFSTVFADVNPPLEGGDLMSTLYTPKAENVVEQKLLNMRADHQLKAWVFFTDKGIFSYDEYVNGLEAAKNSLSERALERRLRARGENPVDFRDIPIHEGYVNSVLNTGAELKNRTKWFNGISVITTVSNLERIADLPFVRRVEQVKALGKELKEVEFNPSPLAKPFDSEEYMYDYGISASQLMQVNVPPAHIMGFDGSGVLICMLDVGYKKGHDAFSTIINDGRLIAEWDFINDDGETDLEAGDAPTQADHGTLCWSALGGEADGHLYGPSFNADFILGKTEDVTMERHIEEDNWAAAAEWADSIGAQVISASLGYRWFDPGEGDYEYSDLDGNTTIVTIAADLAAYNGIAVCTAQGNEGYLGEGSLIAPADGDSVIAVGAVDAAGIIATFSSWGPTYDDRIKPEINARGVSTDCADPDDLQGYRTASGTSLATPLAGGVAGVILTAHPNWTPMMVREAMMMTADRYDNPDNQYGWGTLNAMKAIQYSPEGDLEFDFAPLFYANPGSAIEVSVEITCSDGVNSSSVTLHWNDDGSGTYQTVPMSGSGDTYTGNIPAQDAGETIYYYISAESNAGLMEYYPDGAYLGNRFTAPVSEPKFFDDFENGSYCWERGGDYSDWGVTATESYSGNLSYTESPQGNYWGDRNYWTVLKRPLDFSSASNPRLRFYHSYNLQTTRDFVYVEGSTDGSTWTQIGEPINGSESDFVEAVYSLADFAGESQFYLRFRFESNTYGHRDGWYVDDIEITWNATGIGDGDDDSSLPRTFAVAGNYPNPFNAGTVIKFQTPNPGNIDVDIFNIAGQKVANVYSGIIEAGEHELSWDGANSYGEALSSGIYFARLNFEDKSRVLKMTLAK
ncbi:MAG: S8 family serine peptidase [candidate division Zixibacteria bacterium]|nr:S8 family serine peptidase [candidate division Zixibacteria bacterium]